VPEMPTLEKGGVLEQGQVGVLEGKGAEAVVPLEKNTEWIKKIADQFKQEAPAKGGASPENTAILESISEKINATLDRLVSAIGSLAATIQNTIGKLSPKAESGNNIVSAIGGAISKLFPGNSEAGGDKTALPKLPSGFTDQFAQFSAKMNEFLDNANKVIGQMGQTANASYSTTNSNVSYDNRSYNTNNSYDQKSTFHVGRTPCSCGYG